MTILAGVHMHHVAGGWPIWIGLGAFLLVIACAAVARFTRRPVMQRAQGHVGPYASCTGGRILAFADRRDPRTVPQDVEAFDARILEMLRQKGEPMSQTEIAANVGVEPVSLGSWLAGMERRERLGRTWNTEQSTYVVHLRDEAQAD